MKKNRHKWISMPLLVMLIWIMAFSGLLYGDHFTLFLKPGFGFLIHISLFISILFAVSFVLTENRTRQNDTLLNAMIMLVPVIFIFAAGDNTLGDFALSKRIPMTTTDSSLLHDTGLLQNSAESKPDELQQEKDNIEGNDSKEQNKNRTNQQKGSLPSQISFSALFRDWQKYRNRNVSIAGILHNEKTNEYDKKPALVYRYLMTCCAADARPIGFFVDKAKTKGFENNQWVKVTGVVHLKQVNGCDAIVMDLEHIQEIEKPSKGAAYIFL